MIAAGINGLIKASVVALAFFIDWTAVERSDSPVSGN